MLGPKLVLLADFWHLSCRTDLGVKILENIACGSILTCVSLKDLLFPEQQQNLKGTCTLFKRCYVLERAHLESPKHCTVSRLQRQFDRWHLFQAYYEARNDYTNNSETILLCNKCACNWKINSQTINVCNEHVHRKYLMKAPNYTNLFLPESPVPCVTDVLCNWEINSQTIKCVCNPFGPHSNTIIQPLCVPPQTPSYPLPAPLPPCRHPLCPCPPSLPSLKVRSLDAWISLFSYVTIVVGGMN